SMSVTRAARTRYSTPSGPTSQGSATQALDRDRARRNRGPRSPHRRWALVRSRHVAGCGRPVLHSGRRWVIYGIASAAPCAPPGGGFPSSSHAPHVTLGHRRQGGRAKVDETAAGGGRDLDPARGRWIRPVIWRRYWMKLSKVGELAAV